MSTFNEHIDELCARVILGEATESELQELQDWKSLSSENESYFEEFQGAFDQGDKAIPQIQVDVDAAWNKVYARINASSQETPVIPLKQRNTSLIWKIAASVVILIGISIVLVRRANSSEDTYAMQSFNEAVRDTLSDGTVAVLNTNSQLTYSYDEKSKQRKVTLKGEAFFDIQHNDSIGFLIQTEDLFIRDIGTAFNVQANPDNDTIKVFVKEGMVDLYTHEKTGIRIEEEETGYYVKSKRLFGKMEKSEDVNPDSYATGDFRFRNTRLEKVVNKLSQYFDVEISLESSSMNNCPWSIHFLDSDLDTILGVFAETFNFTVDRNGDKIVLKGGVCQELGK